MAEKIPSVESLYSQLSSFANQYDHSFATGESDMLCVKRSIGYPVIFDTSEYADTLSGGSFQLYDKSKASITVERNPTSPQRLRFQLKAYQQHYLEDLPAQLDDVLPESVRESYQDAEPGDLMLEHSHRYTVEHDPHTGKAIIDRNIKYSLWDNDFILHRVSETKLRKRFKRVPVASEQRTLLLHPVITQESLPDDEQVFYGAALDQILSESDSEHHREAHRLRTESSTLAVLAIFRFIKTGHKLPNLLDGSD